MSTVRGALWVASTHASTTAARQTVEALRTRDTVDLLSVRYALATTAHRAGHLFEVMHAHSFNHHALVAGSPLRALVTEWVPRASQTAAADLVVVKGRRVAAQVQAKLYESTSGTAHEVAR